jgi:AAA domain
MSLTLTLFRDHAAAEKAQRTVTTDELRALIRDTSAPAKSALPWLKLARFGNSKTPKGSLRHDQNVVAITGIEADYDSGSVGFDEAVEIAENAGLLAILYTSPSHTPERPRWRILCPTASELPPDQRSWLLARVNGLYQGIFAAESWALSQSYYFGRVNRNPDHRVEIGDGQTIDALDELDQIAIGKPQTQPTLGNGLARGAGGVVDEAVLIEQICTADAYHTPAMRLLGSWAHQGVAMVEAEQRLRTAFECVFPLDRDDRWRSRVASIPEMLSYVYGKEAGARERARANGGAGWTEPGEGDVLQQLGIKEWRSRVIAPPDFQMGEVLSSTTRAMLVGPSGLGKTHFAFALTIHAAARRDFLHWRSPGKPVRVLYIDGEMSARLMQRRIDDAARRLGTVPETMFVLNREDFPDLPPFNTEAGQKFVDRIIDIIGGADLVVFDNIQALCVGIMAEEESWQPMLPWIRSLTMRKIGQLWIHHTGHDESHAHGTKTREWQLDTVMLMERIDRPELDIAFKLTFTKSRERSPENRADFEPSVIMLAEDRWLSERGGHVRTKRNAKSRALELLQDALAREGTIPPACEHIPPNTPCVTLGLWRELCRQGCISDSDDKEAVRQAFHRATKGLIGTSVEKWDPWVWVIR